MNTPNPKHDIKLLIGNTLRWGVTVACAIAFVGGAIYLARHGGETMKDYTTFDYNAPHPEEYTTLTGILRSVGRGEAAGWIQLGVIALIITPILRVVLSFFDFLQEHDWLYAAITAIVFSVILLNSLGGAA